jgi:hypothetical protein
METNTRAGGVWILERFLLFELADDGLLACVRKRHGARLGVGAAVGRLLLFAFVLDALGLGGLFDGLGDVAMPDRKEKHEA